MSKRVIKDNDGVAVVEGTPAASLIKDSDKLFSAPIPERKAGEKLVSKDISKIKREADLQKALEDAQEIRQDQASFKLVSRDLSADRGSDQQERIAPVKSSEMDQSVDPETEVAASKAMETQPSKTETEPKRQEAVNKTREYKRRRFVERSAGERAATQGSFITTLQT